MESILASDPITLIILMAAGGGVIYVTLQFIRSRDENDEKNRQAYQQMLEKILANQEATVELILAQRNQDNETLMTLNGSISSLGARASSADARLVELSQVVEQNNHRLREVITHISGVTRNE